MDELGLLGVHVVQRFQYLLEVAPNVRLLVRATQQ
jgi:hypothetical protein